jgi:hypothetical protein
MLQFIRETQISKMGCIGICKLNSEFPGIAKRIGINEFKSDACIVNRKDSNVDTSLASCEVVH